MKKRERPHQARGEKKHERMEEQQPTKALYLLRSKFVLISFDLGYTILPWDRTAVQEGTRGGRGREKVKRGGGRIVVGITADVRVDCGK